jgi:hypothetical protein
VNVLLQHNNNNSTASRNSNVSYSIAFNGTTIPPVVQICPHVSCVVGTCAPNHTCRPDKNESVKDILSAISKLGKAHLADEVFFVVISFQVSHKLMSLMALLAVQPQCVNIKSDFIKCVVKTASSLTTGTFLGWSGDVAHAAEI